jgi:hypothetical protein
VARTLVTEAGDKLLHVEVQTDEPGSVPVAFLDPRSNLLTIIEAGAAGDGGGALAHDIYGDLRAAGKAVARKLQDRLSDPDEGEYVHQLVAEAFGGPCPPGHKLVHLNGIKTDNRWENLAYVPESDPRPAAPLKPRPPRPSRRSRQPFTRSRSPWHAVSPG